MNADSHSHDSAAEPREIPTVSPQPPAVAGPSLPQLTAAYEPPAETREESDLPAIPGYELVRELGRGGMGVVFEARQVPLNRRVALKMILAGDYASPEAKVRFLAEAEALAQVQHPHIIQIHEFGQHQGKPFFAMEFVAGGGLDRRLNGTPLPSRDAAALVATLAEAIQAAHERGIVHRDLKPANVLIADKERGRQGDKEKIESVSLSPCLPFSLSDMIPKVTDFGLAKRLELGTGMTATGVVMGTPSYMAPEQAEGKKQIGPAADIYALGAILYECLTGRPPFKAATPLDTIMQVVSEEPVPPGRLQPGLPRDVETICLKCLQKDPAKRYATAAELEKDLRHFLDGQPIRARPVGRLERLVKWARRRPALAALVAVVFLALVGLTVAVIHMAQLNQALHEINTKEAAERNRADENLRHAVDAVGEYLLAVAQDRDLRDNPTLLPLRRKMLQTAQQFFEELAGQPDDPLERQVNVALAWDRLGQIYMELGQVTKAEKAYQASLRRWQALVQDEPDNVSFRSEWGNTCNNLGNLYRAKGRHADARKLLEEALTHQRSALHAEPENARFRLALSNHYLNLGYVLADLHETEPALAALDEARKNYEPLAAEDSTALGGLALAYNNRGKVLSDAKRFPEAAQAYREALQRQEQLVREEPEVPQYQMDLARTWSNLGLLHIEAARPQEAETAFRTAVTVLQKVVDRYPLVPDYTAALGRYRRSLGLCLRDQDKPTEAVEHFQKSYTLFQRLMTEHPDVPEYRQWLLSTAHDSSRLLIALERNREAVPVLRQKIALRENQGESSPPADILEDLAEDYQFLAQLLSEDKDTKETIAAYRRELQCRTALVKFQSNRQTEWARAVCLMNVGALTATNAPTEARQHLEEACRVLERLTAQESEDMKAVVALGGCRCNLGNFATRDQRWREALDWFGKAEQTLQAAVRQVPADANAQDFLRKTYINRIDVLNALGRYGEELADWERLLALTPAARRETYFRQRNGTFRKMLLVYSHEAAAVPHLLPFSPGLALPSLVRAATMHKP